MAKEEIEYIKYEEQTLPDVETVQEDFQYWKSIEKLDANIALRNWGWWSWSVSDWWDIWWTLSDQTDLQAEFDAKQETLVSWTNIKTINWNSVLWSWDLSISVDINPYWRDDNGYFKLPVWNSMYQ